MSHSSPDLFAASLYCDEDANDVVSSDAGACIYSDPPQPSDRHEASSVTRLIASEHHHMPHPDYLRHCRHLVPIDLTSRQDSINWILKVHSHYQFRPVTAFLSVNYFDRFLSSHSLPKENGWPFQLLAMACLSLAAKMEERYVPLLLNFHMFEPTFVFEPKTVKRMELCVMANLNWRLRSVTPFDYIDYFISKLPCFGSEPGFIDPIISVSSDLIFSTIRVIDFVGFPPSIIAASAVLAAAGESADLPETFYETVNKEMVRNCYQLIDAYLVDTCPSVTHVDRIPAVPSQPSPDGVLDAAACGSCDTRSDNPAEQSRSKRHRSSASGVVQQPQ